MKAKRFLCLFLCFVILSLSFVPIAYADNRDLIVYYAVGSKSAYCYHKKPDCPSLSRSTVGELTLEEAASRGYTPCSRCHPPAPDFEVLATPRPETGGGGGSFPSRTNSTPAPESPPYVFATYEPIPSFGPIPTFLPENAAMASLRPSNTYNPSRQRSSKELTGLSKYLLLFLFIGFPLGLVLLYFILILREKIR